MIVSHDNQKQIIADNFDGFKQMSVSEAYHLSLMTKKIPMTNMKTMTKNS